MMTMLHRAFVAVSLALPLLGQIPECKDMKTTASGLQYGVLQKGSDGGGPSEADMVECHYTGWLTDGKKFDSSHDRGQPLRFPLKGVIKGWTEGLQLMTPGAKFKFVIPPELGYGDQDNGVIPPKSTLVFEVELLRVISLPKFVPAKADAQKALPSGCKYEVLTVGTGAMAGATEGVAFKYAIFGSDGTLVDCSEQREANSSIGGTKATLPFAFLKDLVDVMKQGEVVRVEVPGNTVRGMPQETVWRLELVGVHKMPVFRALDPKATVTTQSGLKYEILKPGDGKQPKATNTVSALYTGWLPDGTMFDSAHARGMPSEFPLNGVIRGWTEGLQLMKVGGSFLFEIPSELAYGAQGSPPKIGPNQTLIFLVELADVK